MGTPAEGWVSGLDGRRSVGVPGLLDPIEVREMADRMLLSDERRSDAIVAGVYRLGG